MPTLVIADIDEELLSSLEQRAREHGRTVSDEAERILADAIHPGAATSWGDVNAIRQRLAASGRAFSDSVDLLREDRER